MRQLPQNPIIVRERRMRRLADAAQHARPAWQAVSLHDRLESAVQSESRAVEIIVLFDAHIGQCQRWQLGVGIVVVYIKVIAIYVVVIDMIIVVIFSIRSISVSVHFRPCVNFYRHRIVTLETLLLFRIVTGRRFSASKPSAATIFCSCGSRRNVKRITEYVEDIRGVLGQKVLGFQYVTHFDGLSVQSDRNADSRHDLRIR